MQKIRKAWNQISAIDRAVLILGVLWFLSFVVAGFIWKDQLWAVLLELGCSLSIITLMLIQTFRSKDLTKTKEWIFSFRILAFLCLTSADLIPRVGWAAFAKEIYLPMKWIGLLVLVGSFYLDELLIEEKTDSEEIK